MKVKNLGDIYRRQFLVGVIKFHVAFDLSVVQRHEESPAGTGCSGERSGQFGNSLEKIKLCESPQKRPYGLIYPDIFHK